MEQTQDESQDGNYNKTRNNLKEKEMESNKKNTFSLPVTTSENIEKLAKKFNTNKSQIVQIGASLFYYLNEELKDGDKLQIKREDGTVETIKIMPYI